MQLFQTARDTGAFALLSACWITLALNSVLGQESKNAMVSENPADHEACRQQLNIIHSAIQEYQKRNDKFPRWLSDLLPDYLHDAEMLSCPFVRNSGNYKKWRKNLISFPVFGDTLGTYAYEFCTAEVPGLSGKTCREHKQRLLELIGFGVPIVRCLAHRPALNLAYDGTIYQSREYWEDAFVRTASDEIVLHDAFFITGASQTGAASKLVRPRGREVGPQMLDLSSHYNATLMHLSRIAYEGTLIECFPEGLQKIDGVDFDIRGLVHLTAKRFPAEFPAKIEGVAVNRACTRIHFLHGAMFDAPRESKIATYIIHYRDGQTNAVPIFYGKDVKTRWFDPRQQSELEVPKVAWTSPPKKRGPSGDALRLYHMTWVNPRAQVDVTSISFISHLTPAAPFLVAITLDD
ncbi:MAG: hypothetical protein HY735_12120 [Verrucomicrobia bacterium]|nr:hypothetical protein [Verrucomicrobiota bacterium]